MTRTSIFLTIFAVALCSFGLSTAGPLATHVDAYDDGSMIWHGTTSYMDGSSVLVGTVDWAVFAPGVFPAGFTGLSGFTPEPLQFTYLYQILNTGPSPVSSFTVPIVNTPASNAGAVDTGLAGIEPATSSVSAPGSAVFTWSPVFPADSTGVGFSSPNVPMNFFSSLLDTGVGAFAAPVPSPSAIPIPEPTGFILMSLGMAFLWIARFRRRR